MLFFRYDPPAKKRGLDAILRVGSGVALAATSPERGRLPPLVADGPARYSAASGKTTGSGANCNVSLRIGLLGCTVQLE